MLDQFISQFLGIAQPVGTMGTLVILGFLAFERMVEKGYIRIGNKDDKKDMNAPTPTTVTREVGHNVKDLLQPLVLKMDSLLGNQNKLAGYFNHDTTALLTDIRDAIQELNLTHKNYEIIGIKTRDCEKKS